MTFTPDNNYLLSNQDINQFFGVGNDWTPNLLFNNHKLYQLNETYSYKIIKHMTYHE